MSRKQKGSKSDSPTVTNNDPPVSDAVDDAPTEGDNPDQGTSDGADKNKV